jgi:hypothetical protein
MRIPTETPIVVVVNNGWAESEGVKSFIHPESSVVRGSNSILLGKIPDLESPPGLWLEQLRRKDDKKPPHTILIPWSEIVTVVIGPGAVERSAIGFNLEGSIKDKSSDDPDAR